MWFVEHLYDKARDAAGEIVASVGIDATQWDALERRIDLENVKTMGVSADRFPTSCVQAYELLVHRQGGSVDGTTLGLIWSAASSALLEVAPIAPDSEWVISTLKSCGDVVLLTKGDPGIQTKRLEESGLASLFDAVFVVPEKSDAEFRMVLKKMQRVPDESWSVGNSLASDINPALRLGMHCIWIEAHVWEHELRELETVSDSVIRAESLALVPGIIRHG